jgi:hypothetical protein
MKRCNGCGNALQGLALATLEPTSGLWCFTCLFSGRLWQAPTTTTAPAAQTDAKTAAGKSKPQSDRGVNDLVPEAILAVRVMVPRPPSDAKQLPPNAARGKTVETLITPDRTYRWCSGAWMPGGLLVPFVADEKKQGPLWLNRWCTSCKLQIVAIAFSKNPTEAVGDLCYSCFARRELPTLVNIAQLRVARYYAIVSSLPTSEEEFALPNKKDGADSSSAAGGGSQPQLAYGRTVQELACRILLGVIGYASNLFRRLYDETPIDDRNTLLPKYTQMLMDLSFAGFDVDPLDLELGYRALMHFRHHEYFQRLRYPCFEHIWTEAPPPNRRLRVGQSFDKLSDTSAPAVGLLNAAASSFPLWSRGAADGAVNPDIMLVGVWPSDIHPNSWLQYLAPEAPPPLSSSGIDEKATPTDAKEETGSGSGGDGGPFSGTKGCGCSPPARWWRSKAYRNSEPGLSRAAQEEAHVFLPRNWMPQTLGLIQQIWCQWTMFVATKLPYVRIPDLKVVATLLLPDELETIHELDQKMVLRPYATDRSAIDPSIHAKLEEQFRKGGKLIPTSDAVPCMFLDGGMNLLLVRDLGHTVLKMFESRPYGLYAFRNDVLEVAIDPTHEQKHPQDTPIFEFLARWASSELTSRLPATMSDDEKVQLWREFLEDSKVGACGGADERLEVVLDLVRKRIGALDALFSGRDHWQIANGPPNPSGSRELHAAVPAAESQFLESPDPFVRRVPTTRTRDDPLRDENVHEAKELALMRSHDPCLPTISPFSPRPPSGTERQCSPKSSGSRTTPSTPVQSPMETTEPSCDVRTQTTQLPGTLSLPGTPTTSAGDDDVVTPTPIQRHGLTNPTPPPEEDEEDKRKEWKPPTPRPPPEPPVRGSSSQDRCFIATAVILGLFLILFLTGAVTLGRDAVSLADAPLYTLP